MVELHTAGMNGELGGAAGGGNDAAARSFAAAPVPPGNPPGEAGMTSPFLRGFQPVENECMAPVSGRGRMMVIGLLVAAVLVGGAGLWAMRKIGTGVALRMLDIQIDYPLEKDSVAVIGAEREELLEDLESSGQFPQVPLENVQMNPFTLKVQTATGAPEVAPGETEAERLARQHAERMAELNKRVTQLQLNSVMAGPRPLAQISGEIVGIGDVVGEWFTVKGIEGRSVHLEAEQTLFTLTMGQ